MKKTTRFLSLLLTLGLTLGLCVTVGAADDPAKAKLDAYVAAIQEYNRTHAGGAHWNAGLGEKALKAAADKGDYITGLTDHTCYGSNGKQLKGTDGASSTSHLRKNGCTSNQFGGGSQCKGFVRYLSYVVYGSHPYDGSGQWTPYSNGNYPALRSGDLIDTNGHAFVVWYVSDGKVHLLDCNRSGNNNGACMIYMNRVYTEKEIGAKAKIKTVYRYTGSVQPVTTPEDTTKDNGPILADGTYTLTPKCAPSARLDVSGGSKLNKANIQIYKANNTASQKFLFTHQGDGYYTIQASVSGKMLDVANGKTASKTNVWQYTANGSKAQRWKLESAGDGYYYIIPALNTGLCLDVYNGASANKTNVWVYTRNQSNAQKWKITKA